MEHLVNKLDALLEFDSSNIHYQKNKIRNNKADNKPYDERRQ